jgi:hypothetical protein
LVDLLRGALPTAIPKAMGTTSADGDGYNTSRNCANERDASGGLIGVSREAKPAETTATALHASGTKITLPGPPPSYELRCADLVSACSSFPSATSISNVRAEERRGD